MRTLALLIGVLLLAGCVVNTPRPAPAPGKTLPGPPAAPDVVDTGPQVAVDRAALKALPDLVARPELRRAAGNFSPYVVLGQTYEVLSDASHYTEEGLASWYGTKFHGRATSNGEAFDMYSLSAAHKSLPLPSYVRVTNLNNGVATVLRVNDRGPFHDDRLIDLSYAAAVKLGFDLNGTAPVRVEMVSAPTGNPVPRTRLARTGPTGNANPMAAPAGASAANSFYLQAGAFRSREAAARLSAAIQELLGRRFSVALEVGQDAIHRVRIGPLLTLAEASMVQSKLIEANQGMALIVRG